MNFKHYIDIPQEHSLTLQGAVGSLEAILTVPESVTANTLAILGHPHSLQGGTMNNKVVTTLARTFRERNIPTLRFNFRGVGQSQGSYDQGIGESEDFIALALAWLQDFPQSRLYFAGFSFGSFVAYRAATVLACEWLISIAPAVNHYDYNAQPALTNHWAILQGEQDEVVPPEEVYAFAADHHPELPVLRFAETGHFFHGKLIELKNRLTELLDGKS